MLGMSITLKIDYLTMSKIKNRLKQFKNYTPNYNKYYDKKIKDLGGQYLNSYNTNYDLIDKKGDIIVSYRRQSCFAKVFIPPTKEARREKGIDFKSGNKMLIYAIEQDIVLSEKEIKEYFEQIKTLGYNVRMYVYKQYDLNNVSLESNDGVIKQITDEHGENRQYEEDHSQDEKNLRNKNLPCFNRQKVYVFEIDLDKHPNLVTVKILAYLLRNIYEYDHYVLVRWLLEYKNNNPDGSIFDIYPMLENSLGKTNRNYFHNKKSKDYISLYYNVGHTIFNKPYIDLSLKRFKSLIEKQVDNDEEYSCLSKICSELKYYLVEVRSSGRWGILHRFPINISRPNETKEEYLKRIEKITSCEHVRNVCDSTDNYEFIRVVQY